MVIDLACSDPGLKTALLEKDRRFIRPKEVDLLALLEVGEVDYIFIYRSVADQHGLNYIVLSDEINLKDPARAGHYASASVMIAGAEPGDSLRVSGEPMVYALTRLDSASNAEAADAFLDYMLGPAGQAICRINGLPPLSGFFRRRISFPTVPSKR
jgi:molybdate/tungstate transport system substrate-binding protein